MLLSIPPENIRTPSSFLMLLGGTNKKRQAVIGSDVFYTSWKCHEIRKLCVLANTFSGPLLDVLARLKKRLILHLEKAATLWCLEKIIYFRHFETWWWNYLGFYWKPQVEPRKSTSDEPKPSEVIQARKTPVKAQHVTNSYK